MTLQMQEVKESFYGDQSKICELLKEWISGKAFKADNATSDVSLVVTELLIKGKESGLLQAEQSGIAEGIQLVITGLKDRDHPDYAELASAIDVFDRTWPHADGKQIALRPLAFNEAIDNELLGNFNSGLSNHALTRGFWIVWDLFARSKDDSFRKLSTRNTTVPIVVVNQTNHSIVLWLTVELFDLPKSMNGAGGMGFAPDPVSLGLMQITIGDSFLNAMDEVWSRADLQSRYRGRWSISFICPFVEKDIAESLRVQTGTGQDLRKSSDIQGKSAQISTLAALWAAAGEIPAGTYEDSEPFFTAPDKPPLKLVPNVVVSAKVGQGIGEDIGLDKVEEIGTKLGGVASYKVAANSETPAYFDTLVVAEVKYKKDKFNEEIDKFMAVEGDTLHGVQLNRCATIGQLFQLHLLYENRWLIGWKKRSKQEWEGRWEEVEVQRENGETLRGSSGSLEIMQINEKLYAEKKAAADEAEAAE